MPSSFDLSAVSAVSDVSDVSDVSERELRITPQLSITDRLNKVRIGIIGAGQGGFALLQSLQDIPQVDVVGICDVDDTSPALVEASEQAAEAEA